ncbi:MAG: MMPL family transporter [Deltaproteobacteria bacterium]|nr:MMPL family transporter [Deltaproteobacteria bacterium]
MNRLSNVLSTPGVPTRHFREVVGMQAERKSNRIVHALETVVGAVARFSYQRAVLTLVCITLFSILSFQGARRLTIDTDMIALLPTTFRSVQDLETLKKRYGGSGVLTFYIHGAPAEFAEKFALDIEKAVAERPWVRSVDAHRPNHFFELRGLYFMALEDLKKLRDQLGARVEWERLNANPLMISLSDSPAPEFEIERFMNLENKYMRDQAMSWAVKQNTSDLYHDDQSDAVVVMVRPNGLATDLVFCKSVVTDSEKVVAALNPASYHPDLKVELTGRFKQRIDQQTSVTGDLKLASITAALLMLFYLAFHFRRWFAIVLIYTPLLLGIFWTFAFAGIAFDSLNILTGLIGAVLLGVGIDHGIHLLGSYESSRADNESPEEALANTFGHTGRAVLLAAITTAVGFTGPALSEFRAFAEFGTVAAAGMLLIVSAYILVMPALLSIAERTGWRAKSRDPYATSTFYKSIDQWKRGALIATATAALLLGFAIPYANFDYDFQSLQGGHDLRSVILNKEVGRILGHSQSPLLLMADSGEEALKISEDIRARQRTLGEASTIDFVAAQADLVPNNQAEKKLVMDEIYTIARKVKSSQLERPMRRKLRQLKKMAKVEPFGLSDLPLSVQQRFSTIDGSDSSGVLLVYPSIAISDGARLRYFAEEIRNSSPEQKPVVAAGEAMVLADILEVIFIESPQVMLFTLVAVFFTVLILFGNLKTTVFALLPATITMVFTCGLVALTPVHFDYLNIVMIPVLFGLGVDGGIHIMTRYSENQNAEQTMQETSRAITGALLTSALGFGAMFLTSHPALRSLAALSLVGLAANLLSCLVGLPSLLAMLSKRSLTHD